MTLDSDGEITVRKQRKLTAAVDLLVHAAGKQQSPSCCRKERMHCIHVHMSTTNYHPSLHSLSSPPSPPRIVIKYAHHSYKSALPVSDDKLTILHHKLTHPMHSTLHTLLLYTCIHIAQLGMCQL